MEFPKELDTEEFRKAWNDWHAYRREAKLKKYTDTGAKRQLARLAKMGHDKAIEAIDYSITQGYQGIWEPKNGRTNNTLTIGPGQRYDPNSREEDFKF